MSDYLRWVGWQFYLLLFWPSRFGRKVEGDEEGDARLTRKQRFSYMLKLLFWNTFLAVLGNLLVGSMFKLCGGGYKWGESWFNVGGGILVGVLVGVSTNVAIGVVSCVALGVAGGISGGVAGGIAFNVETGAAFTVAGGVAGGVVYGAAFGAAVGVGFGVARRVADSVLGVVVGSFLVGVVLGGLVGVAGGLLVGVVVGIAGGVEFGVDFGLEFGVAGGVAGSVAFPFLFCLTYFRIGSYPLDAMLAWFALRNALAQPTAAFRWWRRCPVAWNEVIYLPLPGAGKLLGLATQQNREEGFKQIAFVAAERPLQRRVALEALTEVALGDLEATATAMISSARERLDWTSQSPLALPEDFNETLPRFERAAHQAGQFLTVSSAYRKADALKRAVEEVDALQKTLIASPGKFAPRLLQIANQWRAVLEAEQAQLKQLAAERRETPNPFIFGNPVDERNANVFAGRQDVARQIEECLLGARQSPTLLLHGPRRMGKSSILKQLPRLLGPDFAPALLDCQNPAVAGGESSTASLLHYFSASLSEGLQRRRVEVKPLTAEALAREPFAAFDAWLGRVEQAMPVVMRALLCLDEYERLQRALDAGWGGDFLDALRHTLQHRPRFVLIFTGAHTFAEMGPAWTDRFISARRVRVSFLRPEDVRPLLTKPIPEFDLTYALGAVDAVVAATRCQPFLVQAVAFELVQYLNERQRKEATPADVETAITRALESGGEYFANVWSDAGPEGQAILRQIARGGVAGDVRRLQSQPGESKSLLTSAATGPLKWLREHDVLDDTGKFAVPMMERWVRENEGGSGEGGQ